MNEKTRAAAIKHAEEQFPREACGLVVVVRGKERYWPCRNIDEHGGDQFIMAPEDYSSACRAGEVVGIFHSHVNLPATPSEADKVACEATGLPWYIAGVPSGTWAEIEPSGYEAPLVGRVHHWGTLDCWSIVRDWYKRERGIELINLPRTKDFWKRKENILGDNYKKAGFVDIPDGEPLEVGDVFLMQTGDSLFPNHVALYIGDGHILHHAEGRLSSREVYGGWYQKHTVRAVRYAGCEAER